MFLASALAQPAANNLVHGKYGCSSSSGTAFNGSYQTQPRGSYVVDPNGKYAYSGYDRASAGSFKRDAQGVLHFKGGAFDGGTATPIDRPNKFFLVYPAIPGNRWTCGLVDAK